MSLEELRIRKKVELLIEVMYGTARPMTFGYEGEVIELPDLPSYMAIQHAEEHCKQIVKIYKRAIHDKNIRTS